MHHALQLALGVLRKRQVHAGFLKKVTRIERLKEKILAFPNTWGSRIKTSRMALGMNTGHQWIASDR